MISYQILESSLLAHTIFEIILSSLTVQKYPYSEMNHLDDISQPFVHVFG